MLEANVKSRTNEEKKFEQFHFFAASMTPTSFLFHQSLALSTSGFREGDRSYHIRLNLHSKSV